MVYYNITASNIPYNKEKKKKEKCAASWPVGDLGGPVSRAAAGYEYSLAFGDGNGFFVSSFRTLSRTAGGETLSMRNRQASSSSCFWFSSTHLWRYDSSTR